MAEAPLNLDCFTDKAKQGASWDGATGYDAKAGQRNGGMLKFNRVHLMIGQSYFRFCDRARFAQDWHRAATGPWWAEFETFTEIRDVARSSMTVKEHAARTGCEPLAYAAKLHFAVPYEWGDCGAVIEARLIRRIDAYKGWGDIAYLDPNPVRQDTRDGGAKYIPLQKQEVFQLYIPEIWAHFDQAFAVVRKGPTSMFA